MTPDSKILAELDMYLTHDQYNILYSSERYGTHSYLGFHGHCFFMLQVLKVLSIVPYWKRNVLKSSAYWLYMYLYIGGCYNYIDIMSTCLTNMKISDTYFKWE